MIPGSIKGPLKLEIMNVNEISQFVCFLHAYMHKCKYGIGRVGHNQGCGLAKRRS